MKRLRSRAVARPDLATPVVEFHLGYDRQPDSFAIDANEAREIVANLRGAFAELGESLVSLEMLAPPAVQPTPSPPPPEVPEGGMPTFRAAKVAAERAYLQSVLALHPTNMSECARTAEVDYRYWHALLHKHGLHR